MRNAALIIIFLLGVIVPAPAQAETEVRVYWSVGIMVGGLSIFAIFSSGDSYSEKDTEIKTAETGDEKGTTLLAQVITRGARPFPIRYETPGTVSIYRW